MSKYIDKMAVIKLDDKSIKSRRSRASKKLDRKGLKKFKCRTELGIDDLVNSNKGFVKNAIFMTGVVPLAVDCNGVPSRRVAEPKLETFPTLMSTEAMDDFKLVPQLFPMLSNLETGFVKSNGEIVKFGKPYEASALLKKWAEAVNPVLIRKKDVE